MKYLILDYETRSEADLKKVGAYEYSRHPSTRILCASWRFGTRDGLRDQVFNKILWDKKHPGKAEGNPFQASIWSPAIESRNESHELFTCFGDESALIVAHNALFEQVITRHVFSKYWDIGITHPHERWACTASFAAALALPRNLENACLALNLPVQKDMEGRKLMMKYSKPRKPTKKNPAKWHSDVSGLKRIMQYCQGDVDAETLLFLSIPPLSEQEREIWLLDQKINFRGFEADRDLVNCALKLTAEETQILNQETKILTNGELDSATQRNGVLKWLQAQHVEMPNLQAKTVRDALALGVAEGDAKRLLEIRQAVSKTSTAKYVAFEMRSRFDGRVRDNLMYHGASTGRWSGAGVQPQNFPRGTIEDTTGAAEDIRLGSLEYLRAVYDEPMNVLSSCLRAVIRAPKGKELFCADYSAIEARVLFWMAHHKEGIRAFQNNDPLYEEMAQKVYLVKVVDDVTKLQRQVGKQALLGCGYGMGWEKFQFTCALFGIEVSDEIAELAVSIYRSTHWPVPRMWKNLERASIAAVQNPGKRFKINMTTWWVKDKFLWCELPSGRKLAYYGPEVKYVNTPWDEKRPALYHWSVHPLTRKWVFEGTYGGRLTENVVSGTSRDLMASSMLKIEKLGYEITLSVHDEILAECEIGRGSLDEFKKTMAALPYWAQGCPAKVEGWNGPRYKK